MFNGGSFPAPLTSDEERYYLKLLNNGNKEAEKKLVEHNLRLVALIVKKFGFNNEVIDDYISIGSIGLIKGIRSFDLSKGIKLSTYVCRCIDNEILMVLRKTKNKNKEISLDHTLFSDENDNKLTIIDTIFDYNNDCELQFIEKEQKNNIINIISKCLPLLTPKQQFILEKKYGLNGNKIHTEEEIGIMIGLSQSYINRCIKKALKELCKEIKKHDKEVFLYEKEAFLYKKVNTRKKID